jgi:sugar lactone lactonase YvrE
MAVAIRCVHPAAALLGEGPVWVADEQALFWLDIHGRRIHRYAPSSGSTRTVETPFRIASLAPRARAGFVGGSDRGFVIIDRQLSHFELICHPESHLPGNRFNDGKLDPQGRFWAGTMDDAETEITGALYRLDADLDWSQHDAPYRVPNGPAFSPDGKVMYHTDSAVRVIYRFTLTAEGELLDKETFARFGEPDGHPDGMTVDSEGNLWIAFWDGWCIRQLSPGGEVMQTISMPVQRPTSCAFGGERLDILFVTSARVGLDTQALERQPDAGGLFAIAGLGHGLPSPVFPA